MAISGKTLVVKVGAAQAGPFNLVQELKDASFSQSGANQDVSTFDVDWMKRIQGLKDGSFSLSGFYNPSDTTGQVAIRNAWLNDTTLFVQYLPNATAGFQQEVKVSKFDIKASASGVAEVSIELEGNGAITAV
jgi:predicted secreted protein